MRPVLRTGLGFREFPLGTRVPVETQAGSASRPHLQAYAVPLGGDVLVRFCASESVGDFPKLQVRLERPGQARVTIDTAAAVGVVRGFNTMKAKYITYWIATLLVCAFMAFSAFSEVTHEPKISGAMASLGYPPYMQNILGVAYFCGVLTLLMPRMPILKEWAYAGFVINFIGAFFSHLAMSQQKALMMPVAGMLVLAVSYILRPASRRAAAVTEEVAVEHGHGDHGYPTGATPAH